MGHADRSLDRVNEIRPLNSLEAEAVKRGMELLADANDCTFSSLAKSFLEQEMHDRLLWSSTS